nr:F-box protein At1g70590 isoform X1 [Tanacetum cinerariifolium]
MKVLISEGTRVFTVDHSKPFFRDEGSIFHQILEEKQIGRVTGASILQLCKNLKMLPLATSLLTTTGNLGETDLLHMIKLLYFMLQFTWKTLVNIEKALDLFLKSFERGSTMATVDAWLVYWEIRKKEEGVRMEADMFFGCRLRICSLLLMGFYEVQLVRKYHCIVP